MTSYPISHPNRISIARARERAESFGADEFSDDLALVAGRVVSIRTHGRLVFMDVADSDASMQMLIGSSWAPDAHALAQELGRGDIVQVQGQCGRSRRGEASLRVQTLTLLAPCQENLPNPHDSDISDPETLRRRRTLDLLVHTEARERLVMRSRIIQAMRSSLISDDYLEVETPILHAQPGGAAAESFVTHANALGQDRHLRIAPEFYLERLVIAGFDRVFEFARNFRNEGVDRSHNPEFTALEWYGAYTTCEQQVAFCQQLLDSACDAAGNDLMRNANTRSWEDVWREHFEIDPLDTDAVCARFETDDWVQALEIGWDQIEETLIDPVFITRWPSVLSPLARPLDDDPRWAERWDLYAQGLELGACYQELNDPALQRQLMGEGVDEEFISDMMLGMPPMSGAGLGIDRLVMILTNADHIRQTISFPDFRR